ncbi:MAG TPA: beta-galactosidase [Planctomycetota bacterium]|nr:beta-galactosidase [Planctomycetota bacterium]
MKKLSATVVMLIASSAFAGMTVERIPVHAWWSIPADFSTPERYRELAEAGFTTSMSPFSNLADALKALDAAKDSGVKLFVSCPELKSATAQTVQVLSRHPALAGYHLVDEPSAAAFPELAVWVKDIEALDRNHPCYINLFPTYASDAQLGTKGYDKHIEQFVQTVPVPMISFDNYPTKNAKLDLDVYANLEIVSSAARKAGKPFWGFYQAVRWNVMPARTLAELRLESFSNLLYGAQCVQVFTYWTPPANAAEKFYDAPIAADGKRTAMYQMVKTVNSEIRALSRVFLNAEVLKVMHAGNKPAPRSTPFTALPPLRSLDTGAGNAVVSYLKKGSRQFIAILNRDIDAKLSLKIAFEDATKITEGRKDGNDRPVTETDFTLEPGDVLIFESKP